MNGPTRRRLLTGCGAGLAALAGCSGFPGLDGDEDERPEYDRDALVDAVGSLDSLLPPDAFPIPMPAALQNAHRERGRAYLDDVPEDPPVSNEEVATKLADRRADALAALERDASGRPRDRLETWRRRRAAAANVRGAYLAATGDVDRDDVANGRAQIRAQLASFEAEWTYRATDPVAAAVVHETLERYVESCREKLYGPGVFPDDPTSAVFQVGDLVGDLDGANAAIVDVERLRQQYHHGVGETSSHRQSLAAAAERLRRSLSQTTSDLSPAADAEADDVFDRDLGDTPAAYVFRDAGRAVEERSDGVAQAARRHAPATTVVEAGQGLAAAAAFEAVVEAIRDGRYQSSPSVDAVEAAVERATGALETAWEAEPQSLAVELSKPPLRSVREMAEFTAEGYAEPSRVLATVVLAEAQARAVPEATALVDEQLRPEVSN